MSAARPTPADAPLRFHLKLWISAKSRQNHPTPAMSFPISPFAIHLFLMNKGWPLLCRWTVGLSEVQPNSRTHTYSPAEETAASQKEISVVTVLSDGYNAELLSRCVQWTLEMYAGDEHVNEGSSGGVYEGHAFKNIHISIIQTSGKICVCLMTMQVYSRSQ